MSHYFDKNPNLEHDLKEISFRFMDNDFTFITDAGVFSRDKVDAGTEVLLSVLSKQTLGKDILDLGCGIGVIGICLNKVYESNVTCVDINERAVECTVSNAQRNCVTVNAFSSDKYENVTGVFDEIILNPPIRAGKEVIYSMFKGAKEYLKSDGRLWIVIRKSHGAKSAEKYLKEYYNNVELVDRDKGYYVYVAR